MDVKKLSREQLIILKQHYLTETKENVYMSELADADELVQDETIFEYYSGINFVEEDF